MLQESMAMLDGLLSFYALLVNLPSVKMNSKFSQPILTLPKRKLNVTASLILLLHNQSNLNSHFTLSLQFVYIIQTNLFSLEMFTKFIRTPVFNLDFVL